MHSDDVFRRRFRLAMSGVLLLAFACDSNSECCNGSDGCSSIVSCGGSGEVVEDPYAYPADAPIMHQGAQVHATERLFDFMTENLGELINMFAGDLTAADAEDPTGIGFRIVTDGVDDAVARIDVCITEQEASGIKICPTSEYEVCWVNDVDGVTAEVRGCPLSMFIDDADIRPDSGTSTLNVDLYVSDLDSALPVEDVPIAGDCVANINASAMTVILPLEFNVDDDELERTHIWANTSNISMAGDLVLDIDGGFWCEGADLLTELFLGDPLSLISDQLDAMQPSVDGAFCVACEAGCPAGSSCNDEGICYWGDGTCVGSDVGTEMPADLGCMLQDYSPGLEANLDILFYLANYADPVNAGPGAGLDLAGQVGFYGVSHPCVPYHEPPDLTRYPHSPGLNTNVSPGNQPFMLGIGLSRQAIDLALWGVYASGGLCLSVGPETSDQIATGTFGALLGSLSDLADGENRPMQLNLRPNQPPFVTMGDGVVTRDEDGMAQVESPLLTLHLNDLDIDAYAFIEDRDVRVMTLNVDLEVPIGLTTTPANELEVVVGDLSNAVTRVEGRNAELLDEGEVELLANALPALIGTMVGGLVNIDPIALPDLQGFELVLGDRAISAIDDHEMLGIFADLRFAEPAPEEALVMQLLPIIVGQALDVPTVGMPELRLEMDTAQATRDLVEYAYRINGSAWSYWHATDTLTISDVRLFGEGRHFVEVRARYADDGTTTSGLYAGTELLIDRTAPEVDLTETDGTITVEATDMWDRDAVEMRYRLGDADWTAFGPVVPITLEQLGSTLVRVEVRDSSGNVNHVRQTFVVGDAAPAPQADGGCAQTRSRGMGWGGVLLLGALWWRRRRAAQIALAAGATLGVGLALSGCKAESGTAGGECDCDDGFICVDNTCEPDLACTTDDECLDGQECAEGECVAFVCETSAECDIDCNAPNLPECLDGACVCQHPCPEGCGDGEYCCYDNGACQALPEACEDHSCPPGEETRVVNPATGNPETCVAEGEECTCEPLPPIPAGHIGRYADLAVSPNGSQLVVSAYNATYEDLMVGQITGTEIDWHYVDGVPADGAIVGGVEGPRGGVRERGDDVGNYSSIAVTDAGDVHVAYYAADAADGDRHLRYAHGVANGSGWDWTFVPVDLNDEAGHWTRVILSADGRPGIVYMAPRIVGEGTYATELRYAEATAAAPTTASDFTIHTIYHRDLDMPCGGECAGSRVCAVETNTCEFTGSDCGECADGLTCLDTGACATLAELPALDTLPEGAGHFADAEWLASGALAVAFYDRTHGNLLYTESIAPDFAGSPTILDGEVEEEGERVDLGDVGWSPDLFVDSAGEVWVSYVDGSRDDLRIYNFVDGTSDVIDIGAHPSGQVRVGDDSALVDVGGTLSVVYQDTTTHTVWESTYDASAGWSAPAELIGRAEPYDGAYGFYLDAVNAGGARVVISYRMDNQATPMIRDVVVHR